MISSRSINSSGGGGGSYTPSNYNTNSTKLKKWRAALGKTLSGVANAKLLIVGDSLVSGSGASGSVGYNSNGRTKGLPVRLADLLSTNLCSSRADMVLGSGGASGYTAHDTRYVLTDWTENTVLDNALGKSFFSSTSGANLAFTPATAWDRVQVYYPAAGSQGQFDIKKGATVISSVNAAGPTALQSTTANATLGTGTVNITKTNANSNYMLGIRTWDSTKAEIEVIQAGWSGAIASQFTHTSTPWDSLNEVTALAPDLTVIMITINDSVAGTALATYTTHLQTLITAALASGSVLLATGVPSAVSEVSLAVQQTYIDAVAALAVSNGVVFVDQWRRFESYEISQPLGFYTDTLHPNYTGYADLAMGLFEVIANP